MGFSQGWAHVLNGVLGPAWSNSQMSNCRTCLFSMEGEREGLEGTKI